MAASLDQLGVPQEYRDRVKLMWILTIFLGIWTWVIVAFVWKLDGQEQNQWFQFQLKQNMWVGLASVVLWVIGMGGLVQLIWGVLGFLAINKGEDFEAPIFAGMSK